MRNRRVITLLLLIATSAPVAADAQGQRLPAVTLGVAHDGPDGRRSSLSDLLFEELGVLLELDFEARTPVKVESVEPVEPVEPESTDEGN